mmetsp:Transcript_3008/g.6822  ORF Transcript_3008/g.6822 Transcript_3008/m.6822 type:complete len:949 (-) Transcript_3008:201-3047(-)
MNSFFLLLVATEHFHEASFYSGFCENLEGGLLCPVHGVFQDVRFPFDQHELPSLPKVGPNRLKELRRVLQRLPDACKDGQVRPHRQLVHSLVIAVLAVHVPRRPAFQVLHPIHEAVHPVDCVDRAGGHVLSHLGAEEAAVEHGARGRAQLRHDAALALASLAQGDQGVEVRAELGDVELVQQPRLFHHEHVVLDGRAEEVCSARLVRLHHDLVAVEALDEVEDLALARRLGQQLGGLLLAQQQLQQLQRVELGRPLAAVPQLDQNSEQIRIAAELVAKLLVAPRHAEEDSAERDDGDVRGVLLHDHLQQVAEGRPRGQELVEFRQVPEHVGDVADFLLGLGLARVGEDVEEDLKGLLLLGHVEGELGEALARGGEEGDGRSSQVVPVGLDHANHQRPGSLVPKLRDKVPGDALHARGLARDTEGATRVQDVRQLVQLLDREGRGDEHLVASDPARHRLCQQVGEAGCELLPRQHGKDGGGVAHLLQDCQGQGLGRVVLGRAATREAVRQVLVLLHRQGHELLQVGDFCDDRAGPQGEPVRGLAEHRENRLEPRLGPAGLQQVLPELLLVEEDGQDVKGSRNHPDPPLENALGNGFEVGDGGLVQEHDFVRAGARPRAGVGVLGIARGAEGRDRNADLPDEAEHPDVVKAEAAEDFRGAAAGEETVHEPRLGPLPAALREELLQLEQLRGHLARLHPLSGIPGPFQDSQGLVQRFFWLLGGAPPSPARRRWRRHGRGLRPFLGAAARLHARQAEPHVLEHLQHEPIGAQGAGLLEVIRRLLQLAQLLQRRRAPHVGLHVARLELHGQARVQHRVLWPAHAQARHRSVAEEFARRQVPDPFGVERVRVVVVAVLEGLVPLLPVPRRVHRQLAPPPLGPLLSALGHAQRGPADVTPDVHIHAHAGAALAEGPRGTTHVRHLHGRHASPPDRPIDRVSAERLSTFRPSLGRT